MRRMALEMVHQLARDNPRVVFVGSDLGSGTLAAMQREMPERFFMEGVSEQNLIGVAAGLALEGYIPYVNTIATFLTRRCLEQVCVDLCLHKLPVRLIANGGGMVYAPLGPTHTATEDLALMRALPNMTVTAPCDALEMKSLMAASIHWPGPLYIRLAKGGDALVSPPEPALEIGRAVTLREGKQVGLLTTGIMAQRALQTADLLADQGVACGVLHFHTVKPLDQEALFRLADDCRLLVTLEEHQRNGGLGSAVAEVLCDTALTWSRDGQLPPLLRLSLPEAFPDHYGSQEEHLSHHGLDPRQIAERVNLALGRNRR
ncbi:MAG: transketolase [Magnetococcales bacterium]|nr:transketolase [Magnetococcales bacterium]